ncbi:hypothetical protein RCZ04_05370 [Capnocytophaga sp. HP1101]
MTQQEAITYRLVHQHLIAPLHNTPEAIVAWQGAMQAQDYNYFRWAIGIRQCVPQLNLLQEAFANAQLLRLHLLRCTVQVVAADDIAWLTALCKDRNLRTLQSWLSTIKAQFSEAHFAEVAVALQEMLQGGKSLAKKSIANELSALGLLPDEKHLTSLLLRAEIEGVIASGEMNGKNATWALVSERVPATPTLIYEDSLTLLARKYFRSHSPATVEDFAWWSGLPLTQCKKAIENIATELEEILVENISMYLYRNNFKLPDYSKAVHLLPPYDEYLIGYKSRWIALQEQHEAKAHNKNGLFYPVLLHEGRVVGKWKGSIDKQNTPLTTELFAEKSKIKKTALREAEKRFEQFKTIDN